MTDRTEELHGMLLELAKMGKIEISILDIPKSRLIVGYIDGKRHIAIDTSDAVNHALMNVMLTKAFACFALSEIHYKTFILHVGFDSSDALPRSVRDRSITEVAIHYIADKTRLNALKIDVGKSSRVIARELGVTPEFARVISFYHRHKGRLHI